MFKIERFLIVITFILSSLPIISQNSIGIYGSINYGNLLDNSNIDFFDSDFSNSFGIMYSKKIHKKLELVSQFGHEAVGLISKDLGEENANFDLYWKGNSINMFFGGNYNLLTSDRCKFGLLVLPKIGYVYNQQYQIDEDSEIGITEYYTNKNLLLGVDTRLNFGLSIFNMFDLHIRPGYSFFSYFDNNDYIQRNWSIDVGIFKKLSQN